MVRLYIQLTEEHVSLDAQGRLLKTETTPKRLLEVAQDIFKPYKLNAAETFWWTIYKGKYRISIYMKPADGNFGSRTARFNKILGT